MRRIKAFRPRRNAIRLAARRAFDHAASYGEAWQQFCQEHPLREVLCEKCHRRPAKARHHLIPISKGGQHVRSQVEFMCEPCHEREHPHLQRNRRRRRC